MGKEVTDIPELRKANDSLKAAKKGKPRQFLFDEFWREGELCLLFGESGTGKSVLALRIAEALSRGTPFDGFRMPRGRRRVLYVDMVLGDAQFGERCSAQKRRGRKTHKFSDNLHRDAPRSAELLIEWLREAVETRGIQVIIVDDLSAVKKTHDGVRETLSLMRQLRDLRDELGISILVLADAGGPGRREDVSEADMGRSRVLCGVADGVFGMGKFRHNRKGDEFYLVQTRARSGPVFWATSNAPYCRIIRGETGLLSVQFDDRFAEAMNPITRRRICEVRWMKDKENSTFRYIADFHGISKSTAARLYNKWVPAMDEYDEDFDGYTYGEKPINTAAGRDDAGRYEFLNEFDDPDQPDSKEDDPDRKKVEPEMDDEAETSENESDENESVEADPIDAEVAPIEHAAPPRRSIYDLRHAVDAYGQDIYIEQFEHHTGRPAIWYKFDKKGNKQRYERNSSGVDIQHLNAGPFLNEVIHSNQVPNVRGDGVVNSISGEAAIARLSPTATHL